MSADGIPARDAALLESVQLLARARAGDDDARRAIVERYTPSLTRFVDARLPATVRAFCDASDLVQNVLTSAFTHLERFEHRGVGSFWVWLRTIAHNEVRMAARRAEVGARRTAVEMPGSSLAPAVDAPGPRTVASRKEEYERLEQALGELSERERQALLLRFELDLDYATIAAECGFPSPDAARMAVTRSVDRVGSRMGRTS